MLLQSPLYERLILLGQQLLLMAAISSCMPFVPDVGTSRTTTRLLTTRRRGLGDRGFLCSCQRAPACLVGRRKWSRVTAPAPVTSGGATAAPFVPPVPVTACRANSESVSSWCASAALGNGPRLSAAAATCYVTRSVGTAAPRASAAVGRNTVDAATPGAATGAPDWVRASPRTDDTTAVGIRGWAPATTSTAATAAAAVTATGALRQSVSSWVPSTMLTDPSRSRRSPCCGGWRGWLGGLKPLTLFPCPSPRLSPCRITPVVPFSSYSCRLLRRLLRRL